MNHNTFGWLRGVFFLLTCCLVMTATEAAAEVSDAQTQLQQAIEAEIQAQKKADQWSQEKEQLISEIRQAKTHLDWINYQNKKYTGYIKNEKETVAELERKRTEMDKLREDLEPYLDAVVVRLREFIASDLHFLPQERENRLRFLQDSVNDYHLSMSEKLHRVLEALTVEAEYGRSLEVVPETLSIEGKSIEAEVLRVGRAALFYRSMDGQRVGRMNPDTNEWEALPSKFERPIRDTIEMASQQKAVELVDLPIGGIK